MSGKVSAILRDRIPSASEGVDSEAHGMQTNVIFMCPPASGGALKVLFRFVTRPWCDLRFRS
ncbi:hypothetical protein GCM10023084_43560 [Streptomyces lacrimifluminis]|uniref:Uncharacterized protein n=1 Tax=Streptomyces lacrimifluminis TaxID=1500077 RepID=A0A917KIG2_9ACTN|nr:hypothetical protein GCM10012282_06150 [Streptomyces lacrimifluminis]